MAKSLKISYIMIAVAALLAITAGILLTGLEEPEQAADTALSQEIKSIPEAEFNSLKSQLETAINSGGISPESYDHIDSRIGFFEENNYSAAETNELRLLLSQLKVGEETAEKKQEQAQENESTQETQAEKDEPLLLKNIGVKIGYYDQSTGMAGDFKFTQQSIPFDSIFQDFGFVVPSASSATGQDKANPQPTFILPLGTKVMSLVDGEVIRVTKLYSNDYSIQVARSKNSQWIYETEHVINPLVKEGDKVKAGQVIAEVSDFDERYRKGFGILEIGILRGDPTPTHVCPFAYLDPSLKSDILDKIRSLYKSWEEYRGDSTIYDEAKHAQPGCVTLDPIEG